MRPFVMQSCGIPHETLFSDGIEHLRSACTSVIDLDLIQAASLDLIEARGGMVYCITINLHPDGHVFFVEKDLASAQASFAGLVDRWTRGEFLPSELREKLDNQPHYRDKP